MSFIGIINKCKDCPQCSKYTSNGGHCIGSFKELCENFDKVEMLKYPENFNTSGENVKEDDR